MSQQELVSLEPVPFAQPRAGVPGESIYLQLWRDYLAVAPGRLESILRNMPFQPNQRDASICASFMVFMGCNGGRGLHVSAEALMKRCQLRAHDAFMLAWAKENERVLGVNSGVRTIEFMLASEYPIAQRETIGHRIDWQKVPDITIRDVDVVECMVAWWASREGAEMRSVAEPMIEAENRRAMSRLFRGDEVETP